jgi:hypothetical protein
LFVVIWWNSEKPLALFQKERFSDCKSSKIIAFWTPKWKISTKSAPF